MMSEINKDKNGVIHFKSPEKIDNLSFEKWQFWLTEETAALDEKTRCGTVYKAPLTEKDRDDIHRFKEEILVTISSGSKDVTNRADRIIKLATEHRIDFESFYPFAHFYFLFEFSPENQITMGELGEIVLELFGLVDPKGEMEYFWAAESVKGLGNNLKVTIRAGR